jgi:hypothetical protein
MRAIGNQSIGLTTDRLEEIDERRPKETPVGRKMVEKQERLYAAIREIITAQSRSYI